MASKGFTLIEIIVVIGLIAMLAVALLPGIIEGQMTAKIQTCQTLVYNVARAAEAYESQRRFGDFPPDDFRDPRGTYKVSANNRTNIGIESLMAFIHRPDSREQGLLELEEVFCNTDEDKASQVLGRLGRTELVEIMDPWRNPMAYFHSRSYTGGRQAYLMGVSEGGVADPEQTVEPWKKNGRPINPGRFQIFSAGPDGVFNTSDDIGNFEIPEDGE